MARRNEKIPADFKKALVKLYPDIDELAMQRLLTGKSLIDRKSRQPIHGRQKTIGILLRAKELQKAEFPLVLFKAEQALMRRPEWLKFWNITLLIFLLGLLACIDFDHDGVPDAIEYFFHRDADVDQREEKGKTELP